MCYLDNNATTRVAPEVLDAMLPFLRDQWGNPSSMYGFGRGLVRHLDEAREKVAALINGEPGEVVFTSCGTESINSAIQSALMSQPEKRHILTTRVEHSATLKFCAAMEGRGYEVTVLPVCSDGDLDVRLVEDSIRPDTALVSVMWANNETGVLFPIEEIASICRRNRVLFHTDAVQVAGKLPIDVRRANPDLLSLSAHKLCGPKGVGLLYIRRGTRYDSYVLGGGQERGRRGGTENVAGIVGFGRATELAMSQLRDVPRIRGLRDRLEREILERIPGSLRNGGGNRLPNTSNISFEGVEAENVLIMLDEAGICASSGSACASGSLDPSHVLMAMGCGVARSRAAIRFSLGIYNTEDDVDLVLESLPGIVAAIRGEPATEAPRAK